MLIYMVSFNHVHSQNENKKWYFGIWAGLDFMNSPPTPLTGSLNTSEGCASIANAAGGLLFYTDGITIWNQTHAVMANGTGMLGHSSTTQSSIIVKQPGSPNLYYVFSLGSGGNSALHYSIVDMNLAAGMGSVTTKNVLVHSNCQERLSFVKHCNGTDVWIMYHQSGNFDFRAQLLTSAGLNPLAVVSTMNTSNAIGCLKFSANGKRMASCLYGPGVCQLYDFDASTGMLSNPLTLSAPSLIGISSYGCEFSPDASKLYATGGSRLWQWDLCAGSNAAIAASAYSTTSSGWTMQLGTDGKIYTSRPNDVFLGVVNNPNASGNACNYVDQGLNAGNFCNMGLPNFTSTYKTPPAPFTHTVNNAYGCQTASFTAPPSAQPNANIACPLAGYSLTGLLWNFGDPASGLNNTSNLTNPSHAFSSLGTYTTQLILYYGCGGGTDTIKQVVNVTQPCFSVSSSSISCSSLGSATLQAMAGVGPFSYTWMPGNQTNSVATGLSPGTYSIYFTDLSNNISSSTTIVLTPLAPITASLSSSPSITCNGANTGSASFSNVSGGSGNQTYLWDNGILSYTTAAVNTLGSGTWSVTVTDAMTGCTYANSFFITQPSPLNPLIIANTPTACLGSSISFTATNSGGTPGPGSTYTFSWTAGPNTNTYTITQNVAGNYVYTVNSEDANACMSSQTIAVVFVPNPTLSVSDVSICPSETGTFVVNGASSYTWLPGNSTGSSFTQSAAVGITQYSVIGSALSCTSMATASLLIKPTPTLIISHNSPVCENTSLLFAIGSGTSAVWNGPLSFSSNALSNTLSSVQLNQSGLYSVTVTAVNSCTASASASLTIKPLPQFSITPGSSSICVNTTSVPLFAIPLSLSFSLSSYTWLPNTNLNTNTGTITNAYPYSTTVYTVVGSLSGCTNVAQSTVNVVSAPSLTISLSSSSFCANAFNGSPNTITLTSGGANTYTLQTPHYLNNPNPAGPASPLSLTPPYQNTGPATATLLGSNGVCTVSLTANFSVVANPTVGINSYTPIICAGESFTYTTNGSSTFTWSSATPGSTLYTTGNVAVANPSINSVFSVFGGSLGCNSAIQNTSITVNPLPQVSVNPSPARMCLNSTLALSADGNGTSFLWSPPFGLNTYTTQQVITHINQSQSYTVVATLNNCSNTAVAQVSILPLPVPQIIPVKEEVCLYEDIHLKGEGGIYYEWTTPNLQTYTIQNLQLGISNMALAGTYTLKVADANACFNYSTHPVVVHNLPEAYLVPQHVEFCVPYCNSFTFVPNTASQITQTGPWSLNNLIYSGNTFTSCFSKAGEFIISGPIQDEFNCKNTVSLTIIGRPKPTAAFYVTPENPVEGLDEVSFVNVTSNIIGYSWQSTGAVGPEAEQSSLLDWQDYRSEESSPTYVFQEAGVFGLMLMVKNEFNCWDTVMQTIKVESDFAAYIPNAFTPNGDGLNDTFYPVMRGVKKFELQIFGRWGELVFKSTEAENVWDGSFKGQECKQDDYNYKLLILNVKGVEKVYSGNIMLYR